MQRSHDRKSKMLRKSKTVDKQDILAMRRLKSSRIFIIRRDSIIETNNLSITKFSRSSFHSVSCFILITESVFVIEIFLKEFSADRFSEVRISSGRASARSSKRGSHDKEQRCVIE